MLSKMRNLLARFGPMSPAAATKAATVPLCAVCAGYPLVVGPLVAAGAIGSGAFLHIFIPVLAPINLWLLRTSFCEHPVHPRAHGWPLLRWRRSSCAPDVDLGRRRSARGRPGAGLGRTRGSAPTAPSTAPSTVD